MGAGAWRARDSHRSFLSAAMLLPALLIAPFVLFAAYLLLSVKRDAYADLAAIVIMTFGVSLFGTTLIGGILGAWYRRMVDPS